MLCKTCNNELGLTVDAELVDQFVFFRSALEVVGDRGQTPEFSVEHPVHGTLIIGPGLHPKLGARKPDVQNLEGGNVVVTAASERIARQVLAATQ